MRKIELVLRRSNWCGTNGRFSLWNIVTQEGKHVGSMWMPVIEKTFKPGCERCFILEIKAHPAEWTGDDS